MIKNNKVYIYVIRVPKKKVTAIDILNNIFLQSVHMFKILLSNSNLIACTVDMIIIF